MKKRLNHLLAFFLVIAMLAGSGGTVVYARAEEKVSLADEISARQKEAAKEEQLKKEKAEPVSSREAENDRVAANKKRKQNTSASVKSEGLELSTDYIQCVIDENGKFNIGTSDGDCLLFDYPDGRTSETLINIDDTDYWFHEYVTDVSKLDNEKCVATATIEGVKIQQILQIENNPSTSKKDLISIQYRYTNTSDQEKKIGIRIMIDTMLGDNDGAPFKINGAAVTTEREYFGEAIPKIFQAMDSLTDPNVVATGYLYYSAEERPDKVQFACWPYICENSWNYSIEPSRSVIDDSAVAVYFDKKSLNAGSTKTVGTRYGVYNAESAYGYDTFDYDNHSYSQKLAVQLSFYAALAYEDYQYVQSIDNFYAINKAKYYRLKDRLAQDGFRRFKKYNYDDPTENGATFNIASKKVNYHGKVRDLIVVAIRGTNNVEWKGNMNLAESENGPFDEDESYSFLSGKKQIKNKLKEYCTESDEAIEDAMILITGHSRGGAIGNLLAADLTKNGLDGGYIDPDSVYAYLFAVPNCTRDADKRMDNIYNFCFSDDFVPGVPLKNYWNYDKNGTTFTKSAQNLYVINNGFQEKAYTATRLSDQRDPSYQWAKCQDLLGYIGTNWNTVDDYYTKKVKWTGNNTLYKYMHNVIAPAAMGDILPALKLATGQLAGTYQKIADYFVDGTHMAYNVNDNHQMYTYYAALTTNCFNTPKNASVQEATIKEIDENANQKIAVTLSDTDEIAALKNFADQGNNAIILGWDFESGDSLQGITVDESTNCVTEINLEYLDDSEGNRQYLEGTLNLSEFTSLKKVKIAGNKISELILPTADNSRLEYLDCSHNVLSTLNVQNQPLTYCSAVYNYLNQTSLDQLAALAMTQGVEIDYEIQSIPADAVFSNEDVATLNAIFKDKATWNPTAPGSWPGVIWTNIAGVYYVTRLELSACGLSGAADLSGLSRLTYLDCSGNALSSLDVSNCTALGAVQCSGNELTALTATGASVLNTLYCDGNKLSVQHLENLNIQNTEYGWQGIDADVSAFASAEYAVLSPFASVMEWSAEDPGSWREVQWELGTDGKYHVTSLNLSGQKELTGKLDLSVFDSLNSFQLYGSGFSEIIMPNGMTEIPEQAFFGCRNLKEITLPTGLINIGKEAFRECTSLEAVFLPSTVTEIGEGAFRCCNGLNGIYFTGNAPSIGENAFLNVGPSFTIYYLNGNTGFDTEFFETFIRQPVDSFSVYRFPYKTNYYVGDSLDMEGLVLLQLAEDGSHVFIEKGYTVNEVQLNTPGNKTITISYNNQSVRLDITVAYPPVDMFLSSEYKEMAVNTSATLELTADCEYVEKDILKNNITWTSSDPDVAKVEADASNPFIAHITGLKSGYCEISAEIFNDTVYAEINVYIPATGLKLNDVTVGLFQSIEIPYTIEPAESTQPISWTVSDESIAGVYGGRVYGNNPGTCTVTAKVGNITASMRVTVAVQPSQTVNVTRPEELDSGLNQTNRHYEDDMHKLWIYTIPGAQNITVSFSKYCELEEDCDYLFVMDKNNRVLRKWTGKEAAGATVTISGDTLKIYMFTDGSVNEYYGFKVDSVKSDAAAAPAPVKVSGISINGISHNIAAGKKIQLAGIVAPATALNKALIWSSSNPKVATVTQSGVVTVKKKTGGKSVTITATAADGSGVSASWKIKSMKGAVTKVDVNGAKTVKAGKSLKLRAKVTATKGANKKLKWTSSNTKFATVSSSGKVKTLKSGKGKTVKITAMATDGSNKKKTVTIKIK